MSVPLSVLLSPKLLCIMLQNRRPPMTWQTCSDSKQLNPCMTQIQLLPFPVFPLSSGPPISAGRGMGACGKRRISASWDLWTASVSLPENQPLQFSKKIRYMQVYFSFSITEIYRNIEILLYYRTKICNWGVQTSQRKGLAIQSLYILTEDLCSLG